MINNNFKKKLDSKKFVFTAETSPPDSADQEDVLKRVMCLKNIADAVNVTDGASAKSHLSSLVVSSILANNNIEPILQLTTRDRNRIALQSDLLGAWVLNIKTILSIYGDQVNSGDQPEAKEVRDLDSIGIIQTAHQFKTRKTQNIPSQNIISWNKKDFRTNNWNFNLFSIKYVDDTYKLNDLFFLSESIFNYGGNTRIRVQQHTEYIEKFLMALTNLRESENNDDKNQKIINAAQREREIIGSIIGKPNLDSSCKKFDDTKFPELTEKYKNLSYSINLLAKRLDLKRPINLKPICN